MNVTVEVNLGKQLAIPMSGVLQSGSRQIVFVDRGNGYLDPREVQLGPQANDEYIVLKGLKAGERIVTSANFLIDSESQLQAAIGSYASPTPAAPTTEPQNGPAPTTVQIEFLNRAANSAKGKKSVSGQIVRCGWLARYGRSGQRSQLYGGYAGNGHGRNECRDAARRKRERSLRRPGGAGKRWSMEDHCHSA